MSKGENKMKKSCRKEMEFIRYFIEKVKSTVNTDSLTEEEKEIMESMLLLDEKMRNSMILPASDHDVTDYGQMLEKIRKRTPKLYGTCLDDYV